MAKRGCVHSVVMATDFALGDPRERSGGAVKAAALYALLFDELFILHPPCACSHYT